MQEKQLINKLKELQRISPRKDWVLLVKNQILEPKFNAQTLVIQQTQKKQSFGLLWFLPALFYQRKLAYSFATLLFMIVGMFGFAQYTVPGDALFSVKKFTEQSQAALSPEIDQLNNSFKVANRRLSDLTQVVENKRTQNIAPSIKEFQASVFEVADNISVSNLKAVSNPEAVKKVVEMGKKVRELQSRGVIIEEEGLNILELESFTKILEDLITDLENRTLTTKQEVVLDRMKELFEKGEYSEALELYLRNQ
ncbi:MAG: hypothetical protein Q7S77_02410 [Candidatus Staskawiczbacteria bacterium]|nr:hypothetical protein [Candidatus Staskawiczbacteria bacterium]